MKRRRHTPEMIVRLLAEDAKLLGEGKTIDEVARHFEITKSTWHRWRNQYGGMKADDPKELCELRNEKQRLNRIVADQASISMPYPTPTSNTLDQPVQAATKTYSRTSNQNYKGRK